MIVVRELRVPGYVNIGDGGRRSVARRGGGGRSRSGGVSGF